MLGWSSSILVPHWYPSQPKNRSWHTDCNGPKPMDTVGFSQKSGLGRPQKKYFLHNIRYPILLYIYTYTTYIYNHIIIYIYIHYIYIYTIYIYSVYIIYIFQKPGESLVSYTATNKMTDYTSSTPKCLEVVSTTHLPFAKVETGTKKLVVISMN